MSLINDALKRAKLAQQQAPATPVPVLQLRQLEPAPAPSSRQAPGLLLPVAMAAVALFGLLFVWQLEKRSDSPRLVAAKTPPAQTAPADPAPAPPVAASSALAAQIVSPPSPASADSKITLASDAATDEAPGSSSTVAAVAPPAPPPLKLQAIIFNPRRPSALISGRIAFVGDKFGDLRLVGITRSSATLAGGGQTNVLSLPE